MRNLALIPAAPRPLAVRVDRQTDALAKRMLAAFVEEIPIYSQLPAEQLEGEILDIARHNLRAFFRFLQSGEDEPPADELAAVRESASRRAEERVPLDAVLAAYDIGARLAWEAVVEEATADEHADLVEAARAMLRYTSAISATVAGAYVDERQAIHGEERDAVRRLAEAVLAGEARGDVATQYIVLAMRIGVSPDERDPSVVGAVASRRKVRRLEGYLAAQGGPGALHLFSPAAATVLLPLPVGAVVDRAAVERAERLVFGLAAAAGADIIAGLACRPTLDQVPEAAAEASEVVQLADALERGPGVHCLDDVVLEYLLSRPGVAGGLLVGVLDPLEGGPELLATLEGWFEADFDRRRAAAALHVHPNTLDYRLRRIAELTGLSLATARGVQVLGAAMTLRRLRSRR